MNPRKNGLQNTPLIVAKGHFGGHFCGGLLDATLCKQKKYMTIPKILKNKTSYLKYSTFRKKKNQTNDASKRYLYLFYTTLQLTWVAHRMRLYIF